MKKLFALMSILLMTTAAQAQMVNQTQRQFKRSAATIIFASLGGGVLGLSTLSFYGRPEEHTGNITSGAALGLITGIVYVAMDTTKPKPAAYSQSPWIQDSDFVKNAKTKPLQSPVFAMNFSF